MDLEKAQTEFRKGVISTIIFLRHYAYNLIILTFQPRVFADRFNKGALNQNPLTSATLFLITTVVLLTVFLDALNQAIDARDSIAEVGIVAALQSGEVFNLSWEELAKRAFPLAIAMFGINWGLAHACGKGRAQRLWLQHVFPYALWRAAILVTVFCGIISGVSAIIFFAFASAGSIVFMILILVWQITAAIILLVSLCLAFWRLNAFLKLAHAPDSVDVPGKLRRSIFMVGVLATLLLPIWWSSVALMPAADKVAISAEKNVKYSPETGKFKVTIEMRNLSAVQRPTLPKAGAKPS